MSDGTGSWSRAAPILVAVALLALHACGGDDAPGGTPPTGPATGASILTSSAPSTTGAAASAPVATTGVVVEVAALDNSFRPQELEIDVGDEVVWENRGVNEHNVLSVVGDDWGVEVADFQPGAVYSHVFREPGEYTYYCSIHGSETVGMVGTIRVRG